MASDSNKSELWVELFQLLWAEYPNSGNKEKQINSLVDAPNDWASVASIINKLGGDAKKQNRIIQNVLDAKKKHEEDTSDKPTTESSTNTNTGSTSTITRDIDVDHYSFDDNNKYANKDSGVEIDGFLFFPEEINGDNSYSNREYNRTKIMSGGEFVTRGQYQPRTFSFKTILALDPDKPNMYDKVFEIMENKPCEVISPYMGDKFNAEIEVNKTHPKASPRSLVLDVKISEIVEPKSTLAGDVVLNYPSTDTLSDDAVSVSTNYKPKNSEAENERQQITSDWKVRDNQGNEYHSPYNMSGH